MSIPLICGLLKAFHSREKKSLAKRSKPMPWTKYIKYVPLSILLFFGVHYSVFRVMQQTSDLTKDISQFYDQYEEKFINDLAQSLEMEKLQSSVFGRV